MNLLKHYFNMNLAVRNTYHFFITKRDIKVKSFSTLSSLLADNNSSYEEESGSSLIEEDNSNNSENNDNNLLSPIESENSPHSNSGDGYETDSNRSFFEEGADSMADYPARDIPEDHLRRYIKDTGDINRHPEKAGIEREEDQEFREWWANRNQELRDELRRRKDEGLIPDSSSESWNSSSYTDSNEAQDSNSNRPDNGEAPIADEDYISEGNAAGIGTSSNIEQSESRANDDKDSSSTNKRKFVEDEDSTIPLSRRFKQDSSDITGNTEPFDFIGGEDS